MNLATALLGVVLPLSLVLLLVCVTCFTTRCFEQRLRLRTRYYVPSVRPGDLGAENACNLSRLSTASLGSA